jgi:hypothetical protein
MVRLRSKSISVSETTKESTLLKLYLNYSANERRGTITVSVKTENVLFRNTQEICERLES